MKKNRRDLTDLDKAWMRRARRKGMSNAEIGAQFGQSAHWASRICVDILKLPKMLNKRKHRRWTDEEREQFARMWDEGATGREIGAVFGITSAAAVKVAQRMGLPPRTKFLTNKQVAEIKRRVLSGERRAQVAADMGLHYDTVRKLTREAGRFPQPNKKINVGLADRMVRRGMTYQAVGEAFGVLDKAVYKAVRKYRKDFETRAAA